MVLCGCPSTDRPQENLRQIEPAEDRPIELSAEHNTAFVEALKPALAKGIAEGVNQFFIELYEGLDIKSETDSKLMESVFDNMEQQESTISISVHSNSYNKSECRNVTLSGRAYIRLSKIPCAEKTTYAIIVQCQDSIPIKMFRLDLTDSKTWQYAQMAILTKNIDSKENAK